MSAIAEKLKELQQIPYEKVAKLFDVVPKYVGMISRGERIPVRGKGLKIKEYLNK